MGARQMAVGKGCCIYRLFIVPITQTKNLSKKSSVAQTRARGEYVRTSQENSAA